MSAVLPEECSGIGVSPLECPVEWRPALGVNRVGLCGSSEFEEQADDGKVAVLCGEVQRREAVGGDRVRIGALREKICRHVRLLMVDGVMEEGEVLPFRRGEKRRVLLDGVADRSEVAGACGRKDRCVLFGAVRCRDGTTIAHAFRVVTRTSNRSG